MYEVKQQYTGENVIITTGEVHLQRCIDDLVERFAGIEINVSDPIVPFRETIVPRPKIDMVNEAIINQSNEPQNEEITIQTQNKKCKIRLKAISLPKQVINLLEQNTSITKFILNRTENNNSMKVATKNLFDELNNLKKELNEAFELDDKKNRKKIWKKNIVDYIWSIGSKTCPTNLLINYDQQYKGKSFFEFDTTNINDNNTDNNIKKNNNELFYDNYVSNFINGFQMAVTAGPLCEEPMMGVCFIILEWSIKEDEQEGEHQFDNSNQQQFSISGQIMSSVKDGCRKAFQAQPQRLSTPMFSCTVQVSADQLGRMYGVINKRHGRILSEEMQEGM